MARYRGRHRAPSKAGRTLARTAVAGAVVGAPMLVAAPSAIAAPDSTWDKLAQCESGGRWNINTGNGFYGGLQFTPSTWRGFGGKEYASSAHQASRAEQIVVAERVLAKQGWNAWPACSRKLGIRGQEATQRDAPSRETTAEPVRLSAPASTGGGYVVKSGDTLGRIASANDVSGGWQAIVEKNPALQGNPNAIFPGQRLSL
jgi:resuscitation-promoting factor RpfA